MTVVVRITPPKGGAYDALGVTWRDVAAAAGVAVTYTGEDSPSFIAPSVVGFYDAHAFVYARTGKSLDLTPAVERTTGYALPALPPAGMPPAYPFTTWPLLIKGWRAFYADGRETWDWTALRRRCSGHKLPEPAAFFEGAAFTREVDRRDGLAALLNASRSATRALSREVVAIIREVQNDPITMEQPA